MRAARNKIVGLTLLAVLPPIPATIHSVELNHPNSPGAAGIDMIVWLATLTLGIASISLMPLKPWQKLVITFLYATATTILMFYVGIIYSCAVYRRCL